MGFHCDTAATFTRNESSKKDIEDTSITFNEFAMHWIAF